MTTKAKRARTKAGAARGPEVRLDFPAVEFGREICGSLETAEQREWLVTNGLGGFASGTVAGLFTRRYHGLLVAALRPPLGRTLLVAGLEETAQYGGQAYPLATHRWLGGALDPQGYRLIERFRLEGTTPRGCIAQAWTVAEVLRAWLACRERSQHR